VSSQGQGFKVSQLLGKGQRLHLGRSVKKGKGVLFEPRRILENEDGSAPLSGQFDKSVAFD